MTALDISDIIRKENYIYYRREFTATIIFTFLDKSLYGKIEFVIETAPTGKKDIQIKMVESIDYPLIPLIKNLKERITEFDREGKLP